MTEELKHQIRRVLLAAFVDPTRVLESKEIPAKDVSSAAMDRARYREFVEAGEPQPQFHKFVIATEGVPAISHPALLDVSIAIGAQLDKIVAETGASREQMVEMLAVVLLRRSVA